MALRAELSIAAAMFSSVNGTCRPLNEIVIQTLELLRQHFLQKHATQLALPFDCHFLRAEKA